MSQLPRLDLGVHPAIEIRRCQVMPSLIVWDKPRISPDCNLYHYPGVFMLNMCHAMFLIFGRLLLPVDRFSEKGYRTAGFTSNNETPATASRKYIMTHRLLCQQYHVVMTICDISAERHVQHGFNIRPLWSYYVRARPCTYQCSLRCFPWVI